MPSSPASLTTRQVLDLIFKDPQTRYSLSDFANLGKPVHEIINIYPKSAGSGRDAGKTKYSVKSFVPFASGTEEIQVYVEGGKSAPEEIVRQLWVYKLLNQYDYKPDELALEVGVQFGVGISEKAADIVVYTDNTKVTPKIIVECKKPKRKDGIEQLKSYMNAKGAPVAIWSNGSDSIILYRPYPAQFDDTLFDLPRRGQVPKDVLETKKTLLHLRKDFNFKKIIQDLEELVLADSGKDEFNEIFKLIFAKIWDEKEAQENRKDKSVEFRKALDPEITFDRINKLFHKACEEWPGIFKDGEDIELAKRHLQVCVGPVEGVRLMGSNLRIMDDAFEYLLPTEAKKKKGQFFTIRHVVEMSVRMLNPKRNEYAMDPACGSAGFLLHTMDWAYPATDTDTRELRKHKYASKYLWGIDFEARAAKTSRALMLIAGDGHTNIFGPDVSSLDPKTWYENASGQALMHGLRQAKLTAHKIPENETLKDDDKAWEYFGELKFDVVVANPPFAGEMKDRTMLVHYELARRALKRAGDNKAPKEERDVLFIERILQMLKPGGRAAIVLPQGKLNNSSLAFIREWILKKARLLAVVGLHANTFKPHTGTKTSVLFLQKYTGEQLQEIAAVQEKVAAACPDYEAQIKKLLSKHKAKADVPDDEVPEAVADLIVENFAEPEDEPEAADESSEDAKGVGQKADSIEDQIADAEEDVDRLKAQRLQAIQALDDLGIESEALEQKQELEREAIAKQLGEDKGALREAVIAYRISNKTAWQELKEKHKPKQKDLRDQIRRLEREIPEAEHALKLLSNRGKLELVLADADLLGTLKERWIAAEVAMRLDYPIFMAVSERGGKDTSGDYQYKVDENGSLLQFPEGHPQAGQLVVDQDLVNYDLTAEELASAKKIPTGKLCIAEAFVRFAQEQEFDFWEVS
jgi:type I restriction enzyme M protein